MADALTALHWPPPASHAICMCARVVNITARGSFITYDPMDIGVKRPSLGSAAYKGVSVLAGTFC